MRRIRTSRKVMVSLVGAVALILGLVAAPSSQAADGPVAPPTVSEVSLSGPSQVTLRGTQVATLTVQMRIVSPDGDVTRTSCGPGSCDHYENVPYVTLTGGMRSFVGANRHLTLVSGTWRDGIWRGTVVISAADAPAVTLRSVTIGVETTDNPEPPGTEYTIPLAGLLSNPTVAVTGVDPPVIDVTTSPATARGSWHGTVTAAVRLRLRDSKVPLANRPLVACIRSITYSDGTTLGNGQERTTDAQGRATFTFGRDQACDNKVFFYRVNSGPGLDDVALSGVFMGVPYRYAVSGSASPSTIALGEASTLQGSVSMTHAVGRTVVVQRWVTGQWRDLGRARVRESGRWSYATVPQRRGLLQYRVWKPSDDCLGGRCEYAGTATPSFGLAVL